MNKTNQHEQTKRYYLAYGSNLNLRQMKCRCPDAKKVGTAILKGYRLAFRGHPGCAHLTIDEAPGYEVPLGVFEVSESDELSLDAYEGYPSYYDKKNLRIYVEELGQEVDAFIYVMAYGYGLQSPAPYYLLDVLVGYRNFGFDQKPMKEAFERKDPQPKGNGERRTHIAAPLDTAALREKADSLAPDEWEAMREFMEIPTQQDVWETFQKSMKKLKEAQENKTNHEGCPKNGTK